MKSNFIPKLILLAIASVTIYSCSNDDDQFVNQNNAETELYAKDMDTLTANPQPNEPMIPKPRG